MTLLQQQQQHLRRVVVTGIGAVTPLGINFVQTWQQLCNGHCGVTSLTKALQNQNHGTLQLPNMQQQLQFEQDITLLKPLSCQVAASVPNFYPSSSSRNTSRVVQFALSAAAEAIQAANLTNWWGNDEECQNLTNTNHTVKINDDNDQFHTLNRRRQRTGVSIGTGMSGVRDLVHAIRTLDEGDGGNIRKISPYLVPTILGNSASSRIAIQYGIRGPNVSATTACAAGSHAIGDAVRYIQTNMADIMIAGGGESCIDPLSLIGFHRLRALSTQYNDTPEFASRPFDQNRDGFVMGEGACVLILEDMEHAIQRFNGIAPSLQIRQSQIQDTDASINFQESSHWIEVCGYGATGDAHHITSPDPSGRGAIEAMQQSLREATNHHHATINDIHDTLHVDYINAHATSTPVGDEIEARAIRRVLQQQQQTWNSSSRSSSSDRFDGGQRPTYISSTKGATGHLLGAAGAIEAAFTIQSLVEQTLIPTLNLESMLFMDNDGDDDISSSAATATATKTDFNKLVFMQGKNAVSCPDGDELNIAMSNSFGFGGTNSSLTFRRTKG